MRRASLGLLAFLGCSLATTVASAQVTPFSLNRMEAPERGSEWFANESLDLRGHLRPVFGLTVDGQYRPLVAYNADGTFRGSILRNVATLHVGTAVTLFDRLRIGASMPFVLYQDAGDQAPVTVQGTTFPFPRQEAVGNLRLGADLRLLGEYGDPFTLAVGMQVFFPTGPTATTAAAGGPAFTNDGSVRLQPRLMAAGDLGNGPVGFVYSARVGFMYRDLSGKSLAGVPLGSEFTYGVGAGIRTLDKKLVIGPEIFGSTVVTDPGPSSSNSPLEGLLGAHLTLGMIRLGASAGTGFTKGIGAPQFRWMMSFDLVPEIVEDTDGDGIKDKDDACPTRKGVASPDPKKHGCPADTDGDGVVDDEDACKDVPGLRSTNPETNGCPADTDGDGVYDTDDACVDRPGVKTSDPKTNGCPPDKDGDGILDAKDACPEVAGIPTDDPQTNGCPPDKDRDGILDPDDACIDVPGVKSAKPEFNGCPVDIDGDGILNEQDACPREPGKADNDLKKNGCPKAFVQGKQIKIMDQVKFKTGSAEIVKGDKDSDAVLEAVVAVLKAHPEIKKISIEGHTDNQGKADYNRKLSGQRAESVVKWLAAKGIDKGRLEAKGFGPDKPIDTNDNEAGRKNNRRVEFNILEQGEPGAAGPTEPTVKPEDKPKDAAKPADKPKDKPKDAAKPADKPADKPKDAPKPAPKP
jgi:outer membrane protein OmpA-like peptidoglycan-associated protein